ncbi:MAG TPA: carbon-nitrogen hydrolase [Planctomycetaceae bacterium]|jgi:N-carbamoylputrescine amidase|nr:carbon-nitrogen hydrolase [Planctomycetaceae bacterium]
MPAKTVSVGLIQLRCGPDPAANLAQAVAQIRVAAASGAEVVCLPELFRSTYFCQREDHSFFALAESVPGPTTDQLGQVAKELGVAIIAGLFEKRAEGLYHNTAAVIDADGSLVGKYRKMHIPDDPLFYEKFYFAPGDLGFQAFQIRFAKIGVLVCWDQWYPEAARLTALRGANIVFYPTAIGWHPAEKVEFGRRQHQSWELIQRSHAIANGCFVVSVNRTGLEKDPAIPAGDGIEFWGQSFVADPSGEVLWRGPVDQPATQVVPVDLSQLDFARTHWPFLRDRRVDAYGDITRRYID